MGEYLLGKFVSDRRKTMAMSLRDFGKMCGISHTTIDVIERGYDPRTRKPVNITNSTFEKLSKGLGVPVSTLVELSTGKEKTATVNSGGFSEKDMRLIEWFRSLPEEKRKAILSLGGAPEDLSE